MAPHGECGGATVLEILSADEGVFLEQVLDIPKREWVANIHHHGQADDLGRRLEVAEDAGVANTAELDALPVSGKPIFPLTLPS